MKKNKYNILQKVITVLLFTLFFSVNVKSQILTLKGAGGTGLEQELWLSADKLQEVLPDDQTSIVSWEDQSENQYSFVKHSTYQTPVFTFEGLNYNPSIAFLNSVEDGTPTTADRRTKLVSSVPFQLSKDKAYYIFWVSTVDTDDSETNSTVIAFNTGTYINDIGWNSSGAIRHTTRGGTTNTHSSTGNEYGIGAAIVPNVATTSVSQQQYFNAIPRSATISGKAMLQSNYSPVQAIIGNSTLTTNTGAFFGDIQEIIVLSSGSGSYLSNEDLAKVHSYLALKYGITLQGIDYIDSEGSVVWSVSKNAGYLNNVFGIGRDDVSGLYQKQSHNSDDQELSVFVGDELADLNVQNSSTYFNDKSNAYLILGSNGLSELSDYNYKKGEGNFIQGTLNKDVNYRRNKVYKAQVSGQSSFMVNISTGGLFLLVSSNDPTFAPENTRLYNIENRVAKDVVINDGDYISVALYETAPGGVINGLKLWLKADDLSRIIKDENNNVSVWKDQTSNSNDYSLDVVTGVVNKTAPQYLKTDSRTNFYPSLFFDSKAYLGIKTGPMSVNAPDDFTSFVVYHATDYASNVRLYTHGFGGVNPITAVTRYPGMGFAPSDGVGRIVNNGGGTVYHNGTVAGFKKNTTALHMINTHKAGSNSGSGYAIHDFGGWQDKVSATTTFGNGFRMTQGGIIGGASLTESSFQGLMSEVFFYERALNSDEQDRIRTYLGIKYAITLDADGNNPLVNYDYKLSDGTIVWAGNSLPNQKFHNNVAGLIRDNTSDLFNNKARSSADGATVTMSVAGHTEDGQGVSSELVNDNSGLYWGHNGATAEVSFKGNEDVCGDMEFRLGRIWLVDKTNLSEQTVKISLGASEVFPYSSSSYKVFLLVASSAEDLENNKWSEAIPANFVDGEQVVNYTFRNKYTYFTIGVKALPGSCESCEFKGVKKIEFTNSTWTNGTTEKLFDLGDGFTANVKTSIESGASFYTKYPRSSTSKSLREYRRGQSAPLMTTEIVLSKAATASFQIFEIDREGNRYDNVEVYGMCGTAKVMPKLSYVDSEKRSSYSISSNIARAKNSPRSSYTAKAGKMQVDFDYPVEAIYIQQKATGATTGLQRIGIGPIELSCLTPLPPVNEDGLVMTTDAPESVFTCEEVPYTFRIYNANCSSKPVNFSDILPQGMVWLRNSLSVDDTAVGDDTQINEYASTNELKIDGLIIPGGETLVFRAIAVFEENATSGLYSNESTISYPKIINDIEEMVSLTSCDRWAETCQPTQTQATVVTNSLKPLELIQFSTTNGCYRENNDVTVTIKLNNPNSTISGTRLEFDFNEEFTYINGSLQSSTIKGLNTVNVEEGFAYVEGFDLPTGEHTLTFKLKAPVKDKLVGEVDENGVAVLEPNGTPKIVSLDMSMDMSLESDDVCSNAAFRNLNDFLEVPYCTSKSYIISNKMATQRIKKQ